MIRKRKDFWRGSIYIFFGLTALLSDGISYWGRLLKWALLIFHTMLGLC